MALFRIPKNNLDKAVRLGILPRIKSFDYQELEKLTDELINSFNRSDSSFNLEVAFLQANKKAQEHKLSLIESADLIGLLSRNDYNTQINRINFKKLEIAKKLNESVDLNNLRVNSNSLGNSQIKDILSEARYNRAINDLQSGVIAIESFNRQMNGVFGSYFERWTQNDFLNVIMKSNDVNGSTLPPHLWGTYLRWYGNYLGDHANDFSAIEKSKHYGHWMDQAISTLEVYNDLVQNNSEETFFRTFADIATNRNISQRSSYIENFGKVLLQLQYIGETLEKFSDSNEKVLKLIKLSSETITNPIRRLHNEMILAKAYMKGMDAKKYFDEIAIPKISALPKKEMQEHMTEIAAALTCSLLLDD